jgi:hypothetical protein
MTMIERFLTSCFYDEFPNEFRFFIRDAEPSVPGEPPKLRHLVTRSEGRAKFAAGIPEGWTNEDLVAITVERPFTMPSYIPGKSITYPPTEYCSRVFGSPVLLSPSEIQGRLNKKKPQ